MRLSRKFRKGRRAGNMYDVVALGELLIDFIQNSAGENGNPVFEANPGGAPCNVLAMLILHDAASFSLISCSVSIMSAPGFL